MGLGFGLTLTLALTVALTLALTVSLTLDVGGCTANKGFMSEQCTESCGTCEQKRQACNRPPDTPPLVTPGEISVTYQRIVRDFPQYNPRLLSQPGHAIAKARSTASPSPWVVTLDNFLDDDEVEADPNPNPNEPYP